MHEAESFRLPFSDARHRTNIYVHTHTYAFRVCESTEKYIPQLRASSLTTDRRLVRTEATYTELLAKPTADVAGFLPAMGVGRKLVRID